MIPTVALVVIGIQLEDKINQALKVTLQTFITASNSREWHRISLALIKIKKRQWN